MRLNNLPKIISLRKKRLGRGLGSGKGKTSGRGSKGQKARGKIPLSFTGGLPLYKKLPLKRGFGNPKRRLKPTLIKLSALNVFKSHAVVDLEQVIKEKIINQKHGQNGVKVLSSGEIEKALTVKLPVSASARGKIEKKGGKVVNV